MQIWISMSSWGCLVNSSAYLCSIVVDSVLQGLKQCPVGCLVTKHSYIGIRRSLSFFIVAPEMFVSFFREFPHTFPVFVVVYQSIGIPVLVTMWIEISCVYSTVDVFTKLRNKSDFHFPDQFDHLWLKKICLMLRRTAGAIWSYEYDIRTPVWACSRDIGVLILYVRVWCFFYVPVWCYFSQGTDDGFPCNQASMCCLFYVFLLTEICMELLWPLLVLQHARSCKKKEYLCLVFCFTSSITASVQNLF